MKYYTQNEAELLKDKQIFKEASKTDTLGYISLNTLIPQLIRYDDREIVNNETVDYVDYDQFDDEFNEVNLTGDLTDNDNVKDLFNDTNNRIKDYENSKKINSKNNYVVSQSGDQQKNSGDQQ